MLTYDNPHIVTLTGAVRYVDRQYVDDATPQRLGAYTLVDAVAARKITRGLAGFVAVENLLDRRYVVGQHRRRHARRAADVPRRRADRQRALLD